MATKIVLVLVSLLLLQLAATAFSEKANPKHKPHGSHKTDHEPGGAAGGIPKKEQGGPAGGIPSQPGGSAGGIPSQPKGPAGGTPSQPKGPAGGTPSQPKGPAGGTPSQPKGPAEGTPSQPKGPVGGIPAQGATGGGGKKWCVAKQTISKGLLKIEFDQLCKEIDCSATGPTGLCYDESIKSKASYAMNLKYQKNGQKDSDCVYEGRAEIVTKDPSWGKCVLISS